VSEALGVRVVLDARPIQEPGRAPTTAAYLEHLLGAFDASPLAGESFALLLQSDLDDPTVGLERLDVIGRRLLPPTRLIGSGAMTVDPFVLRGASVGAAWRAERGGAAGAVYHAAGGGALPLVPNLPVVVTLLDLAPWELRGQFQATIATRFGQRLRAQLLRDASAVIVGSDAVATLARRLLRIRRDRLRVVELAPRPAFVDVRAGEDDPRDVPRYLVYPGRFDARHDVGTVLRALASVAAAGRPADLAASVPWPPRVVVVGASGSDRESLGRAAAREGVAELLALDDAPDPRDLGRTADLVRGARAMLLPVLSEAAGLAAIESIAAGVPVVASAVGPLPDIVGTAGILVPPRDVERLAVALRTAWADERVHGMTARAARERAAGPQRSWADVARETRAVYAEVGRGR
jgi:glycosyltransferase involved in cell wall biosynthesis